MQHPRVDSSSGLLDFPRDAPNLRRSLRCPASRPGGRDSARRPARSDRDRGRRSGFGGSSSGQRRRDLQRSPVQLTERHRRSDPLPRPSGARVFRTDEEGKPEPGGVAMGKRSWIRTVSLYLILEVGSLLGVPMRPEDIEQLTRQLNDAVSTEVDERQQDPSGDPPRRKRLRRIS